MVCDNTKRQTIHFCVVQLRKRIYVAIISAEWKQNSAVEWKVLWPFTAPNPSTVYLTEMVLAIIFPLFFFSFRIFFYMLISAPSCCPDLVFLLTPRCLKLIDKILIQFQMDYLIVLLS